MKILIGGDFCPENRAEQQLIQGNNLLEDKYGEIWYGVDYRILNLEGPITDSGNKTLKVGRHIKFNPEILSGLNKMKIDVLSLANNHIMDYDIEGYNDTIDSLNSVNIDYIGTSSKKLTIISKNNISVALLSFSNKEFSLISDYNDVGAYPIEIIDILQTLEEVKKTTKNIVILLHTGLSKFPFPSPEQKKLCRFLIDHGATSILCQHSHTIGAFEYYNNGFISYGQGSFVFDLNKRKTSWNKGYSVIHHFEEDKRPSFDILPHYQFDDTLQVRLPYKEEEKSMENELNEYNEILRNPSEYEKRWIEFLKIQEKTYFREYYLGKNRIIRRILRKRAFNLAKLMSPHKKQLLLNFMRNDEHKEVLIQILKNK